MKNFRNKILFFINHKSFFVSHRLKIAEKLISKKYEVDLITGEGASKTMEKEAKKILKKKKN